MACPIYIQYILAITILVVTHPDTHTEQKCTGVIWISTPVSDYLDHTIVELGLMKSVFIFILVGDIWL